MLRSITALFAAAAFVAVMAAPAGAGLGPVTYEFDPLSGPPGTVVTVSGAAGECLPPEIITFYLGGMEPSIELGTVVPNPDGSFSGQLVIPLDSVPGTQAQIGAQCDAQQTQYVPFDVTDPPEPSTTTSPTTTTAPATAARAVTASPAFTG
jgi:hypothetical protein